MASKRGIAGSALGSALLGIVLLRGSAPAPSLPAAESQAKSTPSAASKSSVKTGTQKLTSEAAKENTRILKGPWLASQKHFAGETAIPCPSPTQLSFIPTAKKLNQGRGEAVAATEPESSAALGDGTRRVTPGGEQKRVRDSPRARVWCIPDDAQVQAVHRDPILSSITGTKANELGLTFFVRIAALGAAPLLTLLATHFPSIGRYVVSFLQPGLEALK